MITTLNAAFDARDELLRMYVEVDVMAREVRRMQALNPPRFHPCEQYEMSVSLFGARAIHIGKSYYVQLFGCMADSVADGYFG